MSSVESNEILTLRRMQWQRAKGEMNAFRETFWPEYNRHGAVTNHNSFTEVDRIVDDFIIEIEDLL